jgi:multiple sugar transport system permease protein
VGGFVFLAAAPSSLYHFFHQDILLNIRERLGPFRLAPARPHRIKLAGQNMMIAGAILLAAAYFLVWTVFPFVYTFIYSFFDWQPLRPTQKFVGFDNYYEALFDDQRFWQAVANSFEFAFGNVVLGTVICLLVAVMIHSVRRFQAFFRASYFMPTVTGMVAVALVWEFIYQPRFGILNTAIFGAVDFLNLPPPPEIGWLTRPQWAMPSLILFGFWKFLGVRMIILLAGLQNIPQTYYEAAQIDGAGARAAFFRITLPLLMPALSFVIVVGVINSLQVFVPMFVMTDGGPLFATTTLVLLLYEKTFELFRFGYGAAISFILFGFIMILTMIQIRFLRSSWEIGG